MEDINSWESMFQPCQYSDKLLKKLELLNMGAEEPVDIHEVTKAIYYARKYHGSQLRKSGDPYYCHPIEVGFLVAKDAREKNPRYYTTNSVVTAILHDTIEDTTLTAEMIAKIFNEIVAIKVEDLTRLKHEIKITAADTVNLLFAQYKFDVLYIKLFDRLHNMRTIGAMSLEKQEKITNETKACFIPLAYRLKNYVVKTELMKLCRETLLSVESKRHNRQ